MKRVVVACALAACTIAPACAGIVAGQVNFVSRRGQQPIVSETLVWLEPVESGSVPRKPAETVQMLTRAKTLIPHVIAIPVGSTVNFPNGDPISHNLFSLSATNPFDLGLYRQGVGKSHRFDAPGIVNVYCNIHPTMSAVIVVMASPYYTFAAPNGAFTIADAAPGRYRLVAWNEQSGHSESQIDVTPQGRVDGSTTLTLDSRSYREADHMNKDGKPYPVSRPRDY
jgi:plastocyanin